MQFQIRRAEPADALLLSTFAADSFRETFGADNTEADMAKYLAEAFSPAIQAAEITDPASIILLAETPECEGGAQLAGYAYLVRGEPPACVAGPRPIELKRLYVGKSWHGRGVAASLMHAALQSAAAANAQTVWLGVWERNPRAVAFYAKHGFLRVGEHAFPLGQDIQTDWILARSHQMSHPSQAAPT